MFCFLQRIYVFLAKKKKNLWLFLEEREVILHWLCTPADSQLGLSKSSPSDVWCINSAAYPSPPPTRLPSFSVIWLVLCALVFCPCHPQSLLGLLGYHALIKTAPQSPGWGPGPGDASPEQIASDWSHPPVLSTPRCFHLSECSGEGWVIVLFSTCTSPAVPHAPPHPLCHHPLPSLHSRSSEGWMIISSLLCFLFVFGF